MKSLRSGTTSTVLSSISRQLAGTNIHGKNSDADGTRVKPTSVVAYGGSTGVGKSSYDSYGGINGQRGASQGKPPSPSSPIDCVLHDIGSISELRNETAVPVS